MNDSGWSYGSAWADYDEDGDLDVFVCNKNGDKNSLLENSGNANGGASIKCKGGCFKFLCDWDTLKS